MYEFQVQADYAPAGVEIFEGYKTESPKLYAWEVDSDNNPQLYDYMDISADFLNHDQICELLNLPGASIDGRCSRVTQICNGGSKDGKECTYKDKST